MGKVINFRRATELRASALLRRLLLVALLATGLDLVHDGRVGWPAALAPGLAGALSDAGDAARAWLERSPAFCSACGEDPDGSDATEPAPTVASAPAERAAPATPATRSGATERAAPTGDERAQAVGADLSGRVERVIDGDSLQVRIEGLGLIEVRLHGVDTPEYDQPYGSAAKRELRRLVARQRVDLVSETVDSYGRLVATVYRGDVNVNREMVSRGYAWWYRRYARFDFALRRAEKEARDRKSVV